MKKVAVVFVLAVIAPSLVLAWLAVRSLRDQQYALERQRFLLYQGVADGLAKEAAASLTDKEHEFVARVQTMLAAANPRQLATDFDQRLRAAWPMARVGCAATLTGEILSPSPHGPPESRVFLADNAKFLGNRETVEVFWNYGKDDKFANNSTQSFAQNDSSKGPGISPEENGESINNAYAKKLGKVPRNVVPQQQAAAPTKEDILGQQYSKLTSAEAEFRQLIGEETEGTLARFLDNKLNVLCWYRPPRDTNVVFVAQLSLAQIKNQLQSIVTELDPALRPDIAVAVLDDSARPVALSRPEFQANWKRPVVSTEIGEALPHWELAVYLLDPTKLTRSAELLKLTLGLLIALLLLSIGVGSWLIVNDLKRQLALARQKTDFVSNVSHELKTPLTSIRMFAELLAEGRVADPGKRQSYLNIITAESSRLTRLINNVLDFSRMERGEKKYEMRRLDLIALMRETAENYRPHLEAAGFALECEFPQTMLEVTGDHDALAQVTVNLLSNAEKYSGSQKSICLRIEEKAEPLRHVEVQVLDRGPGVPRNCEERIFEKFYRAHDSLSSGIQGSGLGLTLARQIARAHGGEVAYRPREGGGSCFVLRLPLVLSQT
ncbi:MAG TPA: HAMP domain-containing sensor histidine kinase [Verrucomicrobiae bacterium]|nr:HAMP domain-containing sensor histidine kinase [Verrucomicrobiae bacterium]